MTKKGVLLIISAVVLLLGLAAAGGALWYSDFNIKSFDNVYERDVLESSSLINFITVDSESARVIILPSEDEKCIVKYTGLEPEICSAEITTGNLSVEQKSVPVFRGFTGVRFTESRIDIYLPNSYYESLNVETESGSVSVFDGFSCRKSHIKTESGSVKISFSDDESTSVSVSTQSGSIAAKGINALEDVSLESESGSIIASDIKTDYLQASTRSGRIEVSDAQVSRSVIDSKSGRIELTDFISFHSLKANTQSGAILLYGVDSENIDMESASGRIAGSLLSQKRFDASSASGSVNVPKSGGDGECRIKTASGSINIEIK